MSLQLKASPDARGQLKAANLFPTSGPMNLALLGRGVTIPQYVNIESISAPEAAAAAITADMRHLNFPVFSAAHVAILDGLSYLDPASAIGFISTCAAWPTVTNKLTVQVTAGNWQFPTNQARYTWSLQALIAVIDALGLQIDQADEKAFGQERKVTVTGVRIQRAMQLGNRIDLLTRLIEGPLCSLGCIPQEHSSAFLKRCFEFIGKRPAPESAASVSIYTPSCAAERLKILHTGEFYAPRVGGAELVVGNLSEKLAARGHSVTVATSYLAERTFSELNGVHIEQFDIQGTAPTRISGSDCSRYMRFVSEFPCDVMMNYAAQQWATDLALPLIPRLKKRANILAPCGYSALAAPDQLRCHEFHNYFNYTLPWALPHYDALVYHSALYQDYAYGKLKNLSNGVVIPNAVDEAEFCSKPQQNFREKYGIREPLLLLCVANFLKSKGQERLIEALRLLNRPDVALVLVGKDGPALAEFRDQAKGLNVHFLVDIPRADTVSAYYNSNLFVFASHLEASPLVVLEAKAARLPFVSIDIGNVREWKGGVIASLDNLAAEIQRLLNNPAERERLAQEGHKEYLENHTWNSVLDRYEELYRRLAFSKKTDSNFQTSALKQSPNNVWL